MYKIELNKNDVKEHLGHPLYELEDGFAIEVGVEIYSFDHLPTEEDLQNLPFVGNITKDEDGDTIILYVTEDE